MRLPSGVRIEGERVVLRDLEERDVDAFVAAYVDDPPVGAAPTRGEVEGMLRLGERSLEAGERMQLAIADAADDGWRGSLSLHSFDWSQQRAEVGFWVARPWRRRGIAVEAVKLAVAWAFETLGLTLMRLVTTADNVGAQRVAERAGFTAMRGTEYECRA